VRLDEVISSQASKIPWTFVQDVEATDRVVRLMRVFEAGSGDDAVLTARERATSRSVASGVPPPARIHASETTHLAGAFMAEVS
jgi:hypothetical protein